MVALSFVVIVGLVGIVATWPGVDPAYTGVASVVVVGCFALWHQAVVRRLRSEAETDVLTGCLNRRAGLKRLEIEVERAQRYDRSLSLICLDIDRFKNINDTCGHPAGDVVLKAVADVLNASCRKVDSVIRAGGEEFWVLLPETPLAVAQYFAERLRVKLDQRVRTGSVTNRVTASLGLAERLEGESLEQLIGRCDKALYAAKDGGRNRVQLAESAATD